MKRLRILMSVSAVIAAIVLVAGASAFAPAGDEMQPAVTGKVWVFFDCSTPENGYLTTPGNYSTLDEIPEEICPNTGFKICARLYRVAPGPNQQVQINPITNTAEFLDPDFVDHPEDELTCLE